ncbi:transposase [Qipengyuania sp. YG19]|nr:transposase [Qipengyuania huizhouensis]
MSRIDPHFPLSYGVPRVDDRRIVSGIIFVIRNGLRWRDAPGECGPHKTITTASAVGAGWVCSTKSLLRWLRRVASWIG